MEHYQTTRLWKNAFDPQQDGLDPQRNQLVEAYKRFRERVGKLLQLIHSELPSLTVHDITHVDKLWDVASEIAGPDYPINPAEAFVLGGAFLLHDAAHCRAAFPNGLDELKATTDWKDAAAQRGLDAEALIPGSEDFQAVLFDTLRVLHPKQARKLAYAHWTVPGESSPQYLLPDDDLRQAYGDIIGEIAESHWWHSHQLETLTKRKINAPVCVQPAKWEVDMLKIAALLRTADAAHLDANRAPRFLYALMQPTGISRQHWQFQRKLSQATADPQRQELRITGESFDANEQEAWWLAYDTCRMVDGELRAVDRILREHHRPSFIARSLADAHSPEDFARHVPTLAWQPVDAGIKITDVKSLVERFGGERLYGDKPWLALRELLQNARDAVEACRALGGLGPEEGKIEVWLESTPEGDWLHVTDTGIGMSRYVLTSVLLDFGRSLWRSADLRGEWAGLASSGFEAVGQFGIGFFSVFMLGNEVKVLTRRYEAKDEEDANALLHFPNGTANRPVLLNPSKDERLKRHGTRVSVRLFPEKRKTIMPLFNEILDKTKRLSLAETCAQLAPALPINLFIRDGLASGQCVVHANDWLTISESELMLRIAPSISIKHERPSSPWSNIQSIYDKTGTCLARCTVYPSYGYFYNVYGVGIIGGINAGPIVGIAGLMLVCNQQDLARKSAIPMISFLKLHQWTLEQKKSLIEKSQITIEYSRLLAEFGCPPSDLIVAEKARVEISFEDLQNIATEYSKFFLHRGSVRHKDEDDMSSSRFDNDFEPNEILLETEDLIGLDWLQKIPRDEKDVESYALADAVIEALETAWKGIELSENPTRVVVGEVESQNIYRDCIIASRPTSPDEEIPF